MKTGEQIRIGGVIDDRTVRLIGVPFFGIVISTATGLVRPDALSTGEILTRYGYFVFVAAAIWEGNRWLLFRYYPVFFHSNSALKKYVLMLGVILLYSAPVAILLLLLWKWLWQADDVGYGNIWQAVLLITVCVIFVTNFYEKALFVKQSERERTMIDQLERAKVEAELEALKNQVDPHFMFNTLNSLTWLVNHDPNKARQFIEHLAEVYRYILNSKDKDLVLLQDEIAFMHAYAALLELRHEHGFRLELQLEQNGPGDYLIPPVSLMVAIENAVKHNAVSISHPLVVHVTQNGDGIVISNRIIAKRNVRISNGIGLKNLNDRFEKTLGNGIKIDSDDQHFTLHLPLLKMRG